MIEKEYYKCQSELSSITEECDKLKIVIKDLKQFKELKDITGGINDKLNEEQFKDEEHPWITIDKPKSINKKNKKPAYPTIKEVQLKMMNSLTVMNVISKAQLICS